MFTTSKGNHTKRTLSISSAEYKEKILSTSYPAVDTHWKESGEAILFSYTFNPFQGRYEWCLLGEKGSSLAVLDQDVWVKDRVWGLI